MLEELGFCKGIENYSRHISNSRPGEAPPTLMDYLPSDSLVFIDESHVTVGQVGGMYKGDRSRKETLVNYGFRLPSALDNRPLRLTSSSQSSDGLYLFLQPHPLRVEKSNSEIIEQVVRPTGLLDRRSRLNQQKIKLMT